MMKSKQVVHAFGSFEGFLQVLEQAPRLNAVVLPPIRGDELKAFVAFLLQFHLKLSKVELTGIMEGPDTTMDILLPLVQKHQGLTELKVGGSRLGPYELGKLERARTSSTKFIVTLVYGK